MLRRQRPRDRKHRRRAAEQPGQLDLVRSRMMPPRDVGDLARSLPTQGKERNEDEALASAVIHLRVVLALRDAVFVLDGRDRHHLASAFDLLDGDFGDPDVFDPAGVLVLLDRAEAFLDRSLGVDAMKVVERDPIGPQPGEALFDLGAQYLRLPLARTADAALRGDHEVAPGP